MSLYCVTQNTSLTVNAHGVLACDGYWVIVDQYGNYITPLDENGVQLRGPHMSYKPDATNECIYTYSNNQWGWNGNNCAPITEIVPIDNEFMITY